MSATSVARLSTDTDSILSGRS